MVDHRPRLRATSINPAFSNVARPRDLAGRSIPNGVSSLLLSTTERLFLGAAEPTTAMDDYAAAGSNNPAQIGASDDPPSLEVTIRYRNVTDRQVNPSHPVSFDGAREPRDFPEETFRRLARR
jgi:hypothetical protein